jgi:hypothetical protein
MLIFSSDPEFVFNWSKSLPSNAMFYIRYANWKRVRVKRYHSEFLVFYVQAHKLENDNESQKLYISAIL